MVLWEKPIRHLQIIKINTMCTFENATNVNKINKNNIQNVKFTSIYKYLLLFFSTIIVLPRYKIIALNKNSERNLMGL